jgi:spore coat protein CotH
MGLVKSVGDKLDTRIKSGEIKESELIAEASELMNKMKDMPGMGNIQSMLNKMGMGNLGGMGGKVNTGAMEAQLNSRMKMAKMKERMKAKSEAKAAANASTANASTSAIQPTISEEEILKIFTTGEKVDRTPRGAKPSQATGDKKKKKGKK